MSEHESRQIAYEELLGEVPPGSTGRVVKIRDEILQRRIPVRNREDSCVPVFTAGTRLKNSLYRKTFMDQNVQFWPRCLLLCVLSSTPGLGPGLGAGASRQGSKTQSPYGCISIWTHWALFIH
jgi:hypothetical protein